MDTHSISNFNTPQGRRALQRYWHDLVVDQQSFVIPALMRLLGTAIGGLDIQIGTTGERYVASHKLGLRNGFKVFMQEIIVRHYFNNVQALVYLGAVLLLIFLALRFAGLLSPNVALIGIGIEVLMLIMLFGVLFYTPDDEQIEDVATVGFNRNGPAMVSSKSEEELQTIREVLEELEEIGGTYASLGIRLEEMSKAHDHSIRELTESVQKIQGLDQLNSHTHSLASTNELLARLNRNMENLNERIDLLVNKELEFRVRQELQRYLDARITDLNRSQNNVGPTNS